jgi:hypothetical protein
MGQRAFLIKQQTLAEIFQYRGPGWGAVIRIGGELMPEDAQIAGMLFIPPKQAWALIYESKAWPAETLVVPGQQSNKINGITIIDGAVCHLRIVSNIAENPLCQVTALDGIVATEIPNPGEVDKCETATDG